MPAMSGQKTQAGDIFVSDGNVQKELTYRGAGFKGQGSKLKGCDRLSAQSGEEDWAMFGK